MNDQIKKIQEILNKEEKEIELEEFGLSEEELKSIDEYSEEDLGYCGE